jgi:hypothetical protein
VNVYIHTESTVVSDADLAAAMPAFKAYASQVAAVWPRTHTLIHGKPPSQDAWQVVILDDSDQAGALGYHDYTPGGKPISKVFAKTDKQYGLSWTVTLTHEWAEMMADPYISTALQTSDTEFYAQEVGDPVEADSLGYMLDGVLVSDFVWPAWFIPGHPGPRFDQAQHCHTPLHILPGGYMSIYVSGHGWTQVNAEHVEVIKDAADPRFRPRG